MFGAAEFAIRLLARYGALVGFCALTLVLVWSLVMLTREGVRPSLLALAGILILVATLSALAAPAWTGVAGIGAALAARDRALPAPTGPFAVANVELTLAPIAGENSEPIQVRIWYPNDHRQTRRLILYCPGVGGDRSQNALTTANLASHGYIVVAFDDLALQTPAPDESVEQRAIREGRFDFATRADYASTLRTLDQRVSIQAAKAIDILNRFTAIANVQGSPWGGAVDVSQVGFVGYSFGGATAAETSRLDPRIVAVANIDGTLFGEASRNDLDIPYLLILSDMRELVPFRARLRRNFEYLLNERELARAQAQAAMPTSEIVEVRMSDHAAFSDHYFTPYFFKSWLKLDPFRAHEILQTRLLNFLSAYLPVANGSSTPATAPHFDEVLEFGDHPS